MSNEKNTLTLPDECNTIEHQHPPHEKIQNKKETVKCQYLHVAVK